MEYTKGTHLIATLSTPEESLLYTFDAFRALADTLVAKYRLQKLGEVYHNFSPLGYTGVICLSESHLSVHTWPEFGKVNIDIYLSNYQRVNDGTVENMYEAFKEHFKGIVEEEKFLKR